MEVSIKFPWSLNISLRGKSIPFPVWIIRSPLSSNGDQYKIILFTAWEENPERASTVWQLCSRAFSVFFMNLLSVFSGGLMCWGSSTAPTQMTLQMPVRKAGNTSHLQIDIPCLGLAGSLNIKRPWESYPVTSRWGELKPAIIPTCHLPSRCGFLMERELDPLTNPLHIKTGTWCDQADCFTFKALIKLTLLNMECYAFGSKMKLWWLSDDGN